MKVSWIDPESFRSLVDSLMDPEVHVSVPEENSESQPPSNDEGTQEGSHQSKLREIVSQVDELRAIAPSSLGVEDGSVGEESDEAEWEEEVPNIPHQEIEQIRQHLQSIRDRAKSAGIIGEAHESVENSEEESRTANPPETLSAEEDTHLASDISSEIEPAQAAWVDTVDSLELPELSSQTEEENLNESVEAEVESPIQEAIPDPMAVESTSEEEFEASDDDSSHYEPIEGALPERLDHFIDWATQITGAQDLVLVDDHGDLLWGKATHTDLVASTMLALNSHWRSNPLELMQRNPMLNSPLGPNRIMSILPITSRFGQVTLALVLEHSLDISYAQILGDALRWTINGEKD